MSKSAPAFSIPLHRLRANQRPRLWLRPCVTHVRVFGEPAQDLHLQIITTAYLAGQPHVLWDLIECGEFFPLDVGHWSGIAVENLHSAGCAPCISATAMQNIDPSVHDCQNKSLTIGRTGSPDSLHFNDRHVLLPSPTSIRRADRCVQMLPAAYAHP